MIEETRFTIGELSREFGVTLRALRFYGDRGLLNPRRSGVTRLYSRRDRARLKLILLGQRLGFTLTETKQLIELYDQPDGRRRQLELALVRLTAQRQVLLDEQRAADEAVQLVDRTLADVRRRLEEWQSGPVGRPAKTSGTARDGRAALAF